MEPSELTTLSTPLPALPTVPNQFFDKTRLSNKPFDLLQRDGLYFYMRKLESSSEAHITVNGQDLIMLGSNNYLGMTTHPKVKEAAIRAIGKYGVGAGSVRVLGGTFSLHEELEERIAHFKGAEAAVAFSSGYVSNLATLAASLTKGEDLALIDEKIHASLIDGLRMSGVGFRVFHHNDIDDLEKKLSASTGIGNLVIVADGVYSMDGDIARLPDIERLAKKYNAVLILDDAHATGVLGARGHGTAEHFHLQGRVDMVMGTLSKALGGIGGFAAGPKEWVKFLKHNARGFVFSAALPPAVCAGLIMAMNIIEEEPYWLHRLRENTDLMRQGLRQLDFNVGSSQTPIIPVIFSEDIQVFQMTRALQMLGFYVSPVTFPAVPRNSPRLRVSVMATHSVEDILKTLDAFEKARKIIALGPGAASAA